jgi:ABC-2 type transport system ATP-binding protein
MLLGLGRPTAGTALVFGRPYRELTDPARRVGAVLEAADFHPGRTGREHLMTLGLAARLPAVRVDEALALVELTGAARRRVGATHSECVSGSGSPQHSSAIPSC